MCSGQTYVDRLIVYFYIEILKNRQADKVNLRRSLVWLLMQVRLSYIKTLELPSYCLVIIMQLGHILALGCTLADFRKVMEFQYAP